MSIEITDLRTTIIPKSDQLNAEQLLGGPITITVEDVRIGSSDEQPISLHYPNDGGRPYKPCKTMRKVLIFAWGEDGRAWRGKSMTLYNDQQVKFGGMDVGGIRISHLSDIPRDLKVSLTATKGKKALHEIKAMQVAKTVDHDAAITAAQTVEVLKAAFKAAFRSTPDEVLRAAYKRIYDARMVVITKPATADPSTKARSYAVLAEAIKTATSAEAAELELDAARDELPEDQLAELGTFYRNHWSQK